MAVYVLIPGAYCGAWLWRGIAQILTKAGHEVFATSLTGIGERVHLANPDVNLDTHIQDVANVIKFGMLSDVILVGYSYSGMVATGVAELVPEQIKRLVYLDACVPQDGQSAVDLLPPEVVAALMQSVNIMGDGWRVPAPTQLDKRCTPQPVKTITQPIAVRNLKAALLPRAFIYCTKNKGEGMDPSHIPIVQAAARARCDNRYLYFEMAASHRVVEKMPEQLAEILLRLA
jgi:pimeloyl-ACP methyl ester carboxylesterase